MVLVEGGHDIKTRAEYTVWTVGSGGVGSFAVNGADAEQDRIIAIDPWGRSTIVWNTISTGGENAAGGWSYAQEAIDITKTYRYSVWFHRTVLGTTGRFFFGMNGYGSTNGVLRVSDDFLDENTYFWASLATPTTDDTPDEWVLAVGHVFPSDYTDTSNHVDTGRYTLDGTQDTTNGHANYNKDWKWHSSTTTARQRVWMYYTVDTSVRQRFCYPRVDIVDGSEPTIAGLLSGNYYDPYYDNNVSHIGKDKLIVSSNFSEVGPADSLLHYWPMNGNLLNYGSSEAILTNNGAAVTGAGPRDKSYYTFVSTDYMDCPWGAGVSPYPLTLSVWCTGTTTGDVVIGANVGSNLRLYIGITSNTWAFGVANQAWSAGDYTPAAGWNHLALTLADPGGGTAPANLYVNGQLDSRTITFSSYTMTTDIDVGTLGSNQATYHWQGGIMEVRIYNKVLTVPEITVLSKTFDTDAANRTEMEVGANAWYTFGQFREQL